MDPVIKATPAQAARILSEAEEKWSARVDELEAQLMTARIAMRNASLQLEAAIRIINHTLEERK
jgi:hypothetical protein